MFTAVYNTILLIRKIIIHNSKFLHRYIQYYFYVQFVIKNILTDTIIHLSVKP